MGSEMCIRDRHPWRADNPDAVIVARPSRWGNPFRVIRHTEPGCEGWAVEHDGRIIGCWPLVLSDGTSGRTRAARRAVFRFKLDVLPTLDLTSIRGRDVLCWCALDAPCHGDPILRAANTPESGER